MLRLHMNALKRMVDLRGGLSKIELGGGTMPIFIRWQVP